MKGNFITLEGIEGSGKSTSLNTITEILTERHIDFILTKEPGGGPLGKDLRAMLLSKSSEISPEVELLLMMADRKNHIDNLVMPNINKGVWVISDRYLDSTYAYQGGGRQINTSKIDSLARLLDLPQPDLTLLFDLPPPMALDRAKKRSELDRFESEPMDFHERIRAAYVSLNEDNPERFRLIDSSVDFLEVKKQVETVVLDFIV
ncbi:dTMP kinase [Gammaproteobacteria bacterium]|nr:dTMP kinase [Gammaproteobacteria bacterium]|tara:strand:+ start:2876 stop:3490 length:615 start_codon:yes stop_codon:yes gene_type:complete